MSLLLVDSDFVGHTGQNTTLLYGTACFAARGNKTRRNKMYKGLLKAFKKAMELGVDLMDDEQRNQVFDTVVFRVR